MPSPLQRAFEPRSIAVIGASERPESRGFHLWRTVTSSRAMVHPVNPKYRYVGEHKAYAEVSAIPGGVDLAILAIPQNRIAKTLEHMDAQHVGIVLIAPEDENLFVDGLTARMVADAARANGLRLIGPDSIGLAIPARGINASFWPQMPPKGNIALLTQSGMIATALTEHFADTNLGFSAIVNTGSEADLGMPDFIEYFSRDIHTRVIAIQIEAIRDPKRFYSALCSASFSKPVIVLHAGASRSYVPDRLAALRFGTDAGRHEVFAALVRQAGAHLVTNFADFVAAANAFSSGRLPQGEGIRTAILTNGSGFAAMTADEAQTAGLMLPGLSNDTVQTMRKRWPGEQIPTNPVILGAGSDELRFRETLELLLKDPSIDSVLTVLAPNPALDFSAVIHGIASASQASIKPVALAWSSVQRNHTVKRVLAEHPNTRICAIRSPDDAIRALSLLAAQTRVIRSRTEPPAGPRPRLALHALQFLRALVADALMNGRHELLPQARDLFFQTLGLRTIQRLHADTLEMAITAADTLGYPIAMKATGIERFDRKADLNFGELFIVDARSIREAWNSIRKRFEDSNPILPWRGIDIEAIHPHFAERELAFSIKRDHIFGPFIEFGLGGLGGEIHPDRTTALPPITLDEARSIVRQPAIASTFEGFRGMPPVDVDRASELLCLLSDIAVAIPALRTLRLDPLLPEADGFVLLDGTIELWDAPLEPETNYPHLTIGAPPATNKIILTTPDGTTYRARPLAEDDFPRLLEFTATLSEKSFYLRFHTSARLSPERIARLCRIDQRRSIAWVYVCPANDGGERIAALGRITKTQPDEAEFGIVVADHDQRRGLATKMMEQLEHDAIRLGALALYGIVLRGNEGMNALLRKRGYQHEDNARDTILWRKLL